MNLLDQANQAVESANADLQESYAYDYAAIANLRDQEIKIFPLKDGKFFLVTFSPNKE